MRGWPDVRHARAMRGEADRVRDDAGLDLVWAQQQRRDGQAGRVRGGKAGGPHRVRAQVPGRPRAGRRRLAVSEVLQVEDLVELAQVLVDDERVSVSVRGCARPTFYQCALVDRIALGRVV